MRYLICGFLALSLLVSCSRSTPYLLDAQHWDDISVFVEVRPTPPKPGMNEFLVVCTFSNGKPAYDFIVSIQMVGDSSWTQMIQDGHTGVFRRALHIKDLEKDVLKVKMHGVIKPGNRELLFPMTNSSFSSP